MFYGRVNTSDGRCCRSLKESGGVISPIRTSLPAEAAVAASLPSFISPGHLRGSPVPRAIKKMLFSRRRRDIWLLLHPTSVLFGQSQVGRKPTNGLEARVRVPLGFLEMFSEVNDSRFPERIRFWKGSLRLLETCIDSRFNQKLLELVFV